MMRRMLSSPILGKKKENIERILLIEANRPQSRMKIWDVNGTKFFSVLIAFKCSVKQLFRENAIDKNRITVGFISNPMNVS